MNPFKSVLNAASIILTVMVLFYTHTEAFKAGMAIRGNPIIQALGWGTPDCTPK
jgi:hypothetical protein